MTTSIDLGHWRSAISHPDHLVAGRWVLADGVEVDDPDRDGTLVFLTNHPTFGATTIAAIYKDRWQVEERAAAQGDGPGVVPSRAECSFRRRGGAKSPGVTRTSGGKVVTGGQNDRRGELDRDLTSNRNKHNSSHGAASVWSLF